jgi:hypothetical protein
MNFCKIITLSLCIGTLFPSVLYSQIKIDAQFRPRFELRDGYRELVAENNTPVALISQRTRLSLTYKTENLKLVFSPQDVRVWGDENLSSSTGVYGDDASLALFEGYATIKLDNIGWISIGRQQLVYENQRLLAARNWNQNGLAYDAVVFKKEWNKFKIHAGGSWNNTLEATSNNYYLPSRIKTLNFVWMQHQFCDELQISLLHIASGKTRTDTTNRIYFRQTSGFYSEYTNNWIKSKANIYYQYGINAEKQDISALLYDIDIMFQTGRVTPGIGFNYLSGDRNLTNNQDNLFDVLYGARHRFGGHMDYFRNYASQTKNGGLVDGYAYLDIKLTDKLKITNTGHYFWLAQTNSSTPDNKKLGFENELLCQYKFNQWGSIKTGYLMFVATNNMKQLQSTTNANNYQQYFFIELTISPILFHNKAQN